MGWKREALAILLACAVAHAAGAEMYRCRQADGRLSVQQLPCEGASATAAVASAAPASVPHAPVDPQRPTKRARDIIDVTVALERCRENADFAQRSEAIYQAWRSRHAIALADYAPVLREKLREARRAPLPATCNEDWLAELEPLTHLPDDRFTTVDKTWKAFVAALKSADRATALRCLTGHAEARWKGRIDAFSDDDLRNIGAAQKQFRVQWGDDYMKEALAADADNHVTGVVFRNVNEEWRISDL